MELCTLSDVLQMLETFYNMKVVSVECLEAFEDSNLRLKTSSTDGMLYDVVLKLSSLVSPKVACSVDLQTSMMKYLKDSGVRVSNVIETCSNELYFVQKTNRGPDLCGRLLTYMSGEQLDKVPDISPLLKEVGTLVGEMDRILQTFSPTQTENINTEWGLSKASLMREMLAKFCSQDFQLLGTEILDAFEERLLPMIYRFQSGYIHGDVIGSNILVSQEANAQFYAVSGVIDFGDAVEGTYVYEIATLMADVMALNPDKAFDVGRELLDGFCSKFKLHEEELSCVRLCICVRLLQVVVLSEKAALNNPANRTYITRRKTPYLAFCKILWEIEEKDFRTFLKIDIS